MPPGEPGQSSQNLARRLWSRSSHARAGSGRDLPGIVARALSTTMMRHLGGLRGILPPHFRYSAASVVAGDDNQIRGALSRATIVGIVVCQIFARRIRIWILSSVAGEVRLKSHCAMQLALIRVGHVAKRQGPRSMRGPGGWLRSSLYLPTARCGLQSSVGKRQYSTDGTCLNGAGRRGVDDVEVGAAAVSEPGSSLTARLPHFQMTCQIRAEASGCRPACCPAGNRRVASLP